MAKTSQQSFIWAVLTDVALCGAPDEHLVCLPGSNLLPEAFTSPSWGCDPEEERLMPSHCSVMHVDHSDSRHAYTALALHYAMHSSRWTQLHP